MMRQKELLERELSERRRLRRIQIRGLRKEPPCQQDDNSRGGKRTRYRGPELPEEIWCHIHSLMRLQDAARVACVSHTFLRSWRCHPNLLFNGRNIGWSPNGWNFTRKIDHILKNHSGIGVKTLKLEFIGSCSAMTSCLDRWLEIAITPGIEELALDTKSMKAEYNFPCSLLFDKRRGSSIWYLHLVNCAFRPTVELCCLRSLTMLHLCHVRIMGDELGYLLSGCVALQQLELRRCPEITCVKIPFLLQQLSHVEVSGCQSLRMIKNEAPNIRSFQLQGNKLKHSLGNLLQLRNLDMQCSGAVYYAREELPSSAPNLETLKMVSSHEKFKVSMANSKFLHLKYLDISLSGHYDYLYLVSFLDASPSLETLILRVFILPQRMKDESVFEDPSHLRQLPDEYRHHGKLRTVKIARFYAAKSLVELTCHILENATSLECLTLDTTNGGYRCSSSIYGKCFRLSDPMEASKAVLAIRTYIEPKTPPAVNLNVVDPCRRCHAV